MSDSDSDTQISVKMPQEPQIGEEKPAKKPRKKMEVSERRRAASSANLAKAREARLRKKQEKLAAESENQTILNELVAKQKAKKAKRPDNVAPEPVFGKPEKASKKKYVELTESEDSEESEASEESEESDESSSEDSEVEFVLKPTKKTAAKKTTAAKEKAPKRSVIMEQMAAMQAKLDAMEKKEKKSKAAPVHVYFNNQKGGGSEKKSALDAKVNWD